MTSATSTSTTPGCALSPPTWNVDTCCGCPCPVINDYGDAVQSYQINYTPGNEHYTITVYYTRCNPACQPSCTYTTSATSTKYKSNGQYPIQSNTNCIINQKIACAPGNGNYSCPASSCNTN
jgi:hypothetical protein